MKRKNFLVIILVCLCCFLFGYILKQNHNSNNYINVVNVEDFSKRIYEKDDTKRLQRAINYAKDKKINTVVLGAREYNISSPLEVYEDIKISGVNKTTSKITTKGDIPAIASEGYFTPGKGSSGIQIENVGIYSTETTKKTKYAIEMVNTFNSSVKNCYINELGLTKNDVGGIRFSRDGKYQGNHFINAVRESQLNNASIVMESTDSYIQSNEIWGHTRSFAIHLVKSSQFVTSNQIVGSSVNGGIWIEDTKNGQDIELVRITDNYFDGSYDKVDSGTGIIGKNVRLSRFNSNDFWRQMDEGIKLTNSHSNTINSNVFSNNNRRDNGKDDILLDACSACIISDNTFKRESMTTNKGSAIRTVNSNENKNTISNNTIYSPENYNPNSLSSLDGQNQ